MEKLLTTKDLADAIGASESSMRRWTNSGVIQTSRTVGGHRRIPLSDALRFIRETRATIIRPELLGLKVASDAEAPSPPHERLYEALLAGDEEKASAQVLSLYLNGMSMPALFDGPLRFAMERIGALWQLDQQGIMTEHRATDICLRIAQQLRQILPRVRPGAPVAIGGAPSGDNHLLPSMMAAITLHEAGFQDNDFGAETPVELLAPTALEKKASIVWISVTHLDPKVRLPGAVSSLAGELAKGGARLIIGGRQAEALAPRPLPNVTLLRSMTELSAFAGGLMTQLA